jgi:mannose-6-phosphate isomerase-like protein (cupin superfamily)
MPLRGPVPVHAYSKATAEVVPIGPMTGYVFEDGTNTDNRIGCATLEIPPGVSGPPMHWHRFHDECFLITKGTVRFTTPEGSRDLAAGELMVVPPRAVHTFSNASETEPAEFFMTSTPGYYIDCESCQPTTWCIDDTDLVQILGCWARWPRIKRS